MTSAPILGHVARQIRAARVGPGSTASSSASSPARSAPTFGASVVVVAMAAHLLPESVGDLGGETGDLGGVDAARPRNVDGVLLGDPARPAREQHDPVTEADTFAHVVGHEKHGEVGRGPERLELVVQ